MSDSICFSAPASLGAKSFPQHYSSLPSPHIYNVPRRSRPNHAGRSNLRMAGDTISPPSSSSSSSQSLRPTTTDSDWMFFDVARILVRGGSGGDGCVAFRREKGIPRGGPSGGTGGRGGNVILAASSSANTLSAFRGSAAFRASAGARGTGKARTGECARDYIVPVPLGTVVRSENGRLLADLTHLGDRFVAAKGGRGGRGNLAFKTDRNRAPRFCETGELGSERWLRLELKLIADVALVGMPNAGKSTLLRAVSNATPKVADYPFTTIVPNLGVVEADNSRGVVIADVPGLVAGAHKGIGMGSAFLRHVERCHVVIHIIDGSAQDAIERYKAIRMEMELFSPKIARKKEVILVNKADIPGVTERWESELRDALVKNAAHGHRRIALISGRNRDGLKNVLRRLQRLVEAQNEVEEHVLLGDEDVLEQGEPVIATKVKQSTYEVDGWKVQRAYQMTNWDYIEGVARFQRVLDAIGATEALKKAGAKNGDTVICSDRVFEFQDAKNVYSAAAVLDGYVD